MIKRYFIQTGLTNNYCQDFKQKSFTVHYGLKFVLRLILSYYHTKSDDDNCKID